MTLMHVQTRKFDRQEYYRLVDAGILGRGERVELIDGMIVPMSPQNLPHSTSIRLTTMLFTRLFHGTHLVSCQAPISVGDASEPEPDFALITPQHMQECLEQGRQPTCPDLVLEISDSSYAYDTHEKASLYASAGIPDYWVLDLRLRRLEMRREPGPESDAVFGHNYRMLRILHEHEELAPLFAPEIAVPLQQMLPPAHL